MNKAPEKVKLSQLTEDTLLSYEDSRYTLTPSELINALRNDEYVAEIKWYVVSEKIWGANAEHMLERYIEDEYQEMYEDWDERAHDCLKKEHIERIQAILDEAFKDEYATKYWVLDGPEVILDSLDDEQSKSLAEGDQSTE